MVLAGGVGLALMGFGAVSRRSVRLSAGGGSGNISISRPNTIRLTSGCATRA